jgi:hypothetical protein
MPEGIVEIGSGVVRYSVDMTIPLVLSDDRCPATPDDNAGGPCGQRDFEAGAA